MSKTNELTWYQEQMVETAQNRILIGSRQSGKTTTVVETAVSRFQNDDTVIVIAPYQRLVQTISEQITQQLPGDITTDKYMTSIEGSGQIRLLSSVDLSIDQIQRYVTGTVDTVLVDEANYVEQDLLFRIEKELDCDILLTGTPSLETGIVEIWAKHSPYWTKLQIPASDVPHIDGEMVDHYKDSMREEKYRREIEAKIR